jgi:hypothetical protein
LIINLKQVNLLHHLGELLVQPSGMPCHAKLGYHFSLDTLTAGEVTRSRETAGWMMKMIIMNPQHDDGCALTTWVVAVKPLAASSQPHLAAVGAGIAPRQP